MWFLACAALASSTMATPLTSTNTFSSVPTGFHRYCTNLLPFDQEGDSLTYTASCATSGAMEMGTSLSESTIDINNCLANDDGFISGRA